MNPEIQRIVEEMLKRSKADSINESDRQSYFMALSAKLSALLAKEEQFRSAEISKQTKL
jgi:hypothetical protein